jgi:hypothetical protein
MAAKQQPKKQDNPAQSKAFIEKAKEIGAEDGSRQSDALIGHLAKMPPRPRGEDKKKG